MTLRKPVSTGLQDQLDLQKRAVSYDVYDMTVRQLVDMVEAHEIDIAPEYQRHFVWDEPRESELIESIFLGIPVPSLYMAANKDGTWEVVDGVQRLSTLVHFCGTKSGLEVIGRPDYLELVDLSKLTRFNDKLFSDLPKPLQLNFMLRPLRVTTLNDKSDLKVRYDLFERLNTGGIELHPQEIRNCVLRGKFRDDLKELAGNKDFLRAVRLPESEQQSAHYEECVLRFFAFFDRYEQFDHSVKDFLTSYMLDRSKKSIDADRYDIFCETMAWLGAELPAGIVRGNRSTTPINLYEAVAVGVALAMRARKSLPKGRLISIVNSTSLKKYTTAATNSRRMVAGRIETVRDGLLA